MLEATQATRSKTFRPYVRNPLLGPVNNGNQSKFSFATSEDKTKLYLQGKGRQCGHYKFEVQDRDQFRAWIHELVAKKILSDEAHRRLCFALAAFTFGEDDKWHWDPSEEGAPCDTIGDETETMSDLIAFLDVVGSGNARSSLCHWVLDGYTPRDFDPNEYSSGRRRRR